MKVEGVDVGDDPALGFLDLEDVVGSDRRFPTPGGADEGEAPLGLLVDEQAFGEDEPRARVFSEEAEEGRLEVGREALFLQGGEIAGVELDPEPVQGHFLELGVVLLAGGATSASPGRRRRTGGSCPRC